MDALPILRRLNGNYLTRFETRKVIYSADALHQQNIEQGLLQAMHFELLWLQNKREYYELISKEDDKRIRMFEDRWKALNRN